MPLAKKEAGMVQDCVQVTVEASDESEATVNIRSLTKDSATSVTLEVFVQNEVVSGDGEDLDVPITVTTATAAVTGRQTVESDTVFVPAGSGGIVDYTVEGLSPGSNEICVETPSDEACQTVQVEAEESEVIVTTNVESTGTSGAAVTVDVGNNPVSGGGVVIDSVLTIRVDGEAVESTPINLDPGNSITEQFELTGLSDGDHEICADVPR